MDCHGSHPKPGKGPELNVAPFQPLRWTWPEGALPPPQCTAPPCLLHACNVLTRSTCAFGRSGLEILVHESSSTFCTETGRSSPNKWKKIHFTLQKDLLGKECVSTDEKKNLACLAPVRHLSTWLVHNLPPQDSELHERQSPGARACMHMQIW